MKATTNNYWSASSIFGVPLLAFGKRSENAILAGRQLPMLLDEGIFPLGQGAVWHAKHTCTMTLDWHASHLIRRGSAKGEHHLGGIAPLDCDICTWLLQIAIPLHQARGLVANKFVGSLHF